MDKTSLFCKSNIFYTIMATILLFVFSSLHLYGMAMMTIDSVNDGSASSDLDFGLIIFGFVLWMISLFQPKMMKWTFIYLLLINLFFCL